MIDHLGSAARWGLAVTVAPPDAVVVVLSITIRPLSDSRFFSPSRPVSSVVLSRPTMFLVGHGMEAIIETLFPRRTAAATNWPPSGIFPPSSGEVVEPRRADHGQLPGIGVIAAEGLDQLDAG